jgi:cysteine desulfurase
MARIYLDHSATTPMRLEVKQAMEPFLAESDGFGNPSSIHSYGRQAKAALDSAHDTLASALNAEPSEITFTSGGTESDNLAIIGLMTANREKGDHLITSTIEHDAVLKSAQFLETIGFRVTYVKADEAGLVDPQDVAEAITDKTVLVSIMHANNEVGTIEPIAEIAEITRERGVLLHTDAVQSFGQLPVNMQCLPIDAMSVSSHKIYGPKGAGALFVRRGTPILPILHGGGQERGRRSGTENIPAIAGFECAVRLMIAERDANSERMRGLRDRFLGRASERIPGFRINGHPDRRLPNNINFSVPGVEGEAMLLNLDLAGIAASSGSACASGSIEPSHVLLAMNLPPEAVRSALRISLGRGTTQEELDITLDTLVRTTERLSRMTEHTIAAAYS